MEVRIPYFLKHPRLDSPIEQKLKEDYLYCYTTLSKHISPKYAKDLELYCLSWILDRSLEYEELVEDNKEEMLRLVHKLIHISQYLYPDP